MISQPVYGDVLFKNGRVIFLGSFPLFKVLYYKFIDRDKRKIVRWWMGTDVLTLWCFPTGKSKIKVLLHRIKTLLLNRFVSENWFVSEGLEKEVLSLTWLKINNPKVVVHQCNPIKKKKYFVVIGYYMPEMSTFNEWVYGFDMIVKLMNTFRNDIFLRYDGKGDIQDFLSLIDLYVRPARHDGTPRLNLLCDYNKIPYSTSRDFKELTNFIQQAKEVM